MRFINDFDWKKTMQYGWRRILRHSCARVWPLLRLKFRRLSNPNTLVNTVVTDVQAEVKKSGFKEAGVFRGISSGRQILRGKETFAGAPDRGDPASDPVF